MDIFRGERGKVSMSNRGGRKDMLVVKGELISCEGGRREENMENSFLGLEEVS